MFCNHEDHIRECYYLLCNCYRINMCKFNIKNTYDPRKCSYCKHGIHVGGCSFPNCSCWLTGTLQPYVCTCNPIPCIVHFKHKENVSV